MGFWSIKWLKKQIFRINHLYCYILGLKCIRISSLNKLISSWLITIPLKKKVELFHLLCFSSISENDSPSKISKCLPKACIRFITTDLIFLAYKIISNFTLLCSVFNRFAEPFHLTHTLAACVKLQNLFIWVNSSQISSFVPFHLNIYA